MTFEHLDDPDGFVVDDAFRHQAVERGRRRRRRHRLALSAGSVAATVVLLAGVAVGYVAVRAGQIDRTEVELSGPPVAVDEPFNVLLVGTDGQDDPEVVGQRSDTMLLVRVLPDQRVVRVLSLPRDLVVEPLPGGEPDRLNAAFARGGAQELLAVVEGRLGLPVNAYVEVGFDGLVDLVDGAGGVAVRVPLDLRDRNTGLALAASECTVLDGTTTLQLLRSRHLETQGEDGRWVTDPTGELGRMQRQRALVAVALPQLAPAVSGLGGVDRALDLAADHLTLDSRLELGQLADLTRWALDGDISVEDAVLPVDPVVTPGGAAVLQLGAGADAVIATMGGPAVPAGDGDVTPPSTVAGRVPEPVDLAGGLACP